MKRFFNQVLCPLGGGFWLLLPVLILYRSWQGNLDIWIPIYLLGLFPLLYNHRIFFSAKDFDSWREKKEGIAILGYLLSAVSFIVLLFLAVNAVLSWRLDKLPVDAAEFWYAVGYVAALFLLLFLVFLLTPLFRKRRGKENVSPEKPRRFDLSHRWVLGVIVFGWTVWFHLLCILMLLFIRWVQSKFAADMWIFGVIVFVFSLYYMGYTWFLSYYRPRPCVRLFFLLANLWSVVFFYVFLAFTSMGNRILPPAEWGLGVIFLASLWTAISGSIFSEIFGFYRDLELCKKMPGDPTSVENRSVDSKEEEQE